MKLRTKTAEATERVGRLVGGACGGGEIIGLSGALGSGKTCMVRGIAAGIGIDPALIISPSFTLVAEHAARVRLFHIDLYRLESERIDELWLREYLFGTGVAVVEWFDRLSQPVSHEQLWITLAIAGVEERTLTFAASGPRHKQLLLALGPHAPGGIG